MTDEATQNPAAQVLYTVDLTAALNRLSKSLVAATAAWAAPATEFAGVDRRRAQYCLVSES